MTCKSINRYETAILCDFREMFVAVVPKNWGEYEEVDLFVRTRNKTERRMFSSHIRNANDTEMGHRVFIRQKDTFSFS